MTAVEVRSSNDRQVSTLPFKAGRSRWHFFKLGGRLARHKAELASVKRFGDRSAGSRVALRLFRMMGQTKSEKPPGAVLSSRTPVG